MDIFDTEELNIVMRISFFFMCERRRCRSFLECQVFSFFVCFCSEGWFESLQVTIRFYVDTHIRGLSLKFVDSLPTAERKHLQNSLFISLLCSVKYVSGIHVFKTMSCIKGRFLLRFYRRYYSFCGTGVRIIMAY